MNRFPCLIRTSTVGGEARYALGDPLVDSYLAFVAGRSRPNTLRAVGHDLKTFFTVIDKNPVDVVAADLFDFVAHQRGDRSVVRISDGESGCTSVPLQRSARTLAWERAADDLGIVSMGQSGTAFPGSIYVTLDLPAERTGGIVADTGDALAAWVGDFLEGHERQDVRHKLLRSGADERHAFLILPGFAEVGFGVIDLLMRDDAPLPEAEPALPVEVTHVWVVSTWSSGHGMRWAPDQGWSYFDKLISSRTA